MTYTGYVSELNHKISKYGLSWIIDSVELWFNPDELNIEMLEYSVALLEYVAETLGRPFPEKYKEYQGNKLPYKKYSSSVVALASVVGEWYFSKIWNESALEVFKKHNLCVTEVGSAI